MSGCEYQCPLEKRKLAMLTDCAVNSSNIQRVAWTIDDVVRYKELN